MNKIQLANTYNPAKSYNVAHWYATPKFDGVRAVFIPDKGFFTRNDKTINGLDHMATILQEFCKCRGLSFIDGELVVKNCSFQVAQSVILAVEHEAKSHIEFHVFAVGGKFKDTSAMLDELPDFPEANIFRIESEIVTNTFEAIETACGKFTSMGYEGVVLRDPDVPYFEGRSNHLLKFKFFKEADLLIVGENPHDSLVVQGEIDGLKIKSCVRDSLNDHVVGKVLTVKYQSITDKPDSNGFYSLRFPSFIGIKEDRDFPVETVSIRQAKNFTKPTGVVYRKNGIVEADFQVVFTDKPVTLSYIPDKATMAGWKSRLYQCRSIQEGTQLIADLKLTISKIREFARYLGVRLRGCKYLKAEIVRWVINASLGAKLRACRLMKVLQERKERHYAGLFDDFGNKSRFNQRSQFIAEGSLEAVGYFSRPRRLTAIPSWRFTRQHRGVCCGNGDRIAMNKSDLIAHIMRLRREVDSLMDMIIAIEDSKPEIQPVQSQEADGWLTVKQVCAELHISDSTFYEWLNQGLLPPGFEFGPRSKRWKMSEIRAWQAKRNIVSEVLPARKRRGRPSRVMKIGVLCSA